MQPVGLVLLLAILSSSATAKEECLEMMDIALVVDQSDSFSKPGDFDKFTEFLSEMANGFPIEEGAPRLGLVTYAEQATVVKDLDDCADNQCFLDAIAGIKPRGQSVDINAALQMALDRVLTPSGGDRPEVKDVLVLVTDDGVPEGQTVDANLLKTIRSRDIRVVVVGIEKRADTDKLFALASEPFYDNVFFIGKMRAPSDGQNPGRDIAQIGESIHELLCISQMITERDDVIMPEDCMYDIAFLVDTSGSITSVPAYTDNWIQMRQFLRSFISQIKTDFPTVNIAMMHFRTRGNLLFGFSDANNNTDVSVMDDKIRELPYPWGTTAMKTAFETFTTDVIESLGNRPKVPDLVIFMTDGFPNPLLTQDPRQAAANLRDKGVRIFGIGVTPNINEEVMREIVSPPADQNFIPALTYRVLASRARQILAETCMVPGEPCKLKQDVVVLLDVAISEEEVMMQKRVISSLADRLDFAQAKLSLVTFSNEAKVQFDLDKCPDAGCVRKELSTLNIPAGAGESHVGTAFEVAVREVLNSAGDRQDAENTIVLITDGYPDTSTPIGRQAIEMVKESARVVVVAVSEQADKKDIFDLATKPTVSNLFFGYNYSDVLGLSNQLGEKICPKAKPTPAPLPEKCEQDVVLLIDLSKSIIQSGARGQNFIDLREFLQSFVLKIKSQFPNVKLALEHFGETSTVSWPLDGDTGIEALMEKIRQLPKPSGEPRMSSAFEAVKQLFKQGGNREDVPDVLVFITDGFPEPNPFDPKKIATEIKEELGIKIVGMGITDKVQKELLEEIVSTPKESSLVSVKKYSDLHHQVEDLIEKVCTGLPEPTMPPHPCAMAKNVMLLLDSSGSVRLEDFKIMKEFVKHVMQVLPRDGRKVALVKFSTGVDTILGLNERVNGVKKMLTMIDDMKHDRGKTNTHLALAHVSDNILANVRGDLAEEGNNIVVLLTDGDSSDERATIREAKRLKTKAHILVVQVGSWLTQHKINGIASYPPERNVIKVKKFKELAVDSIKQKILDGICNNNGSCPKTVCQNGGVVLDKHGECVCDCPEGYALAKCEKRCDAPVDLVLVVDKSGSIQPNEYMKQIRFIQTLVEAMNFRQQRLGLISFSDKAEVHLGLDDVTDKTRAVEEIRFHHTKGGTATSRALEAARRMLEGVSRQYRGRTVPKVAVILTDGKSQDQEKTFEEAMKLQSEGVHVIAVGMGKRIRQKELEAIASDPLNVFNLDSYDDLETLLEPLFHKLCDNPCRENECLNGGEPRVMLGECVCRCAPGYSGARCERVCSDKIDLGLLVDASGSIRNERFPHVIRFLSQVVGNLTVGPEHARVGAVSWSSSAKLEFGIDQYAKTHDVVSAINMIDFMGQRTNTLDALSIARNRLFSSAVSRPDVSKFLLIFTDGGSNINAAQTIPEAILLKQQGVHITVAAVGDDMDQYELKTIASDPVEENLIWAPNQVALDSLVQQTYMSFCNEVNECASQPCQNGGECVDAIKMYMCKCPPGFAGVVCDKECNKRLDIVLLLDVSGSLKQAHEITATIAKKLVATLNVDSGDHHVGLVSFSDDALIHFSLDTHKAKKMMLDSIAVVKTDGKTNTALGLTVSYVDLFREDRGDRPDADNVLIVVTDAKSNVNPARTPIEAAAAKARNIKVIPVVTGEMNMAGAEEMASDPTRGIVTVQDETQIDPAIDRILDLVCTGSDLPDLP